MRFPPPGSDHTLPFPEHSQSYDSEPDADREGRLRRIRNAADPKSALILAA